MKAPNNIAAHRHDADLPTHGASVWADTPLPNLEGEAHAALSGTQIADVVIIGAGFTGLNAAAEALRLGLSCIVLEARRVGWGASGRNGGMAVLRYKSSWSEMAAQFGNAATKQLYGYIHEAVDSLEQNVDSFGIDCEFSRYGHLTAAYHARAMQRLEADAGWLKSQIGDTRIKLVGKQQTAELIGSKLYAGAYFDPRSAGLHPLNYCKGLKAALAKRGVIFFEGTAADNIVAESEGVVVTTEQGEVRAKHALICTNAYTDGLPIASDIERRILPITVAVVATAPLPSELRATILPQNHLVTDTKNLLNYYRLVDGGRLLFGGRGEPAYQDHPKNHQRLRDEMIHVFPNLADIEIDYRWTGVVGITRDNFPHIGAIGKRVFYAIGYGGRGVALTHLLGKYLARRITGDTSSLGAMSEGAFKPIPFKGLRLPLLKAGTAYYKLKDKLEAL
ncbi:FAD-binding oxidoreductase [Pollutimonas sp. H1-120]|uniref:NAD(P)/FAD-dependent oxidoreductase n=1 Tax=Pollutimonas sp. H1-120 TaxID=3148824 RepID=UPI003B52ADA7